MGPVADPLRLYAFHWSSVLKCDLCPVADSVHLYELYSSSVSKSDIRSSGLGAHCSVLVPHPSNAGATDTLEGRAARNLYLPVTRKGNPIGETWAGGLLGVRGLRKSA